MYKHYVFDFYGTLADVAINEDKEELWERMSLFYSFYGANYDADELKERFYKYTTKLQESFEDPNKGEIDLEDVFYQLFKKRKIKPKKKMVKEAARQFRVLSIESFEIKPGVRKVLQGIKDAGKRIYLLTNGQATFVSDELLALGIDEFFDGVYTSSDLTIKLPASEAFDKVGEEEKISAKKTVYISSDYDNGIKGAAEYGFDTLYIYDGQGKDEKAGKATYVINDMDIKKILDMTVKK